MIKYYTLQYTDTNLYHGKGEVMVNEKKAIRYDTEKQAQDAAKALTLGTEVIWKATKT